MFKDDFVKGDTLTAEQFDENMRLIKTGQALLPDSITTELIKNLTAKLEDLSPQLVQQIINQAGGLRIKEEFVIDGVYQFTLLHMPTSGSENVYLNGILQKLIEFYNITTNQLIILDSGDVSSGDRILIIYSYSI